MTEKQWDTFFETMEHVVDMGGTLEEKIALVKEEAEKRGERAMMAFEEFTAWEFF